MAAISILNSKLMKKIYYIIFSLTILCQVVQGQQLAFPGAEGSGRFTTGGRGGVVYEVTNLNDAGEGSFRAGLEMQGARTIVFRVSGNIDLATDIRIRSGNLTIAGQTAPGDGITIKGSGIIVDANNVIIRYLRFRPGDITGRELDALWGRQNKDIIIDHCSMSWATDEISSFYDNENFTMQWCILSESLYESVHDKGRHGYGGIWGGMSVTFHHNLFAHHSSRTPRFNGARYTTTPENEIVDYRNNVNYNWGGNNAYGGEGGNHNLVNNYYKAGPATPNDEKRYRIVDVSTHSLDQLGKWHVIGNFVEGFPEVTADNWAGGVQRLPADQLALVKMDAPFDFSEVSTETAEAAYASVLAKAGANYPSKDAVDLRILEEVATGTTNFGGAYGANSGIIDSQETVGGWPQLFSAPALIDTDHDGMPDAWEEANGLDPEDDADGALLHESGYSNLEVYLNSLLEQAAESFLRPPTDLELVEVTYTTIQLRWKNNEPLATKVVIERKQGAAAEFEEVARIDAAETLFDDEALAEGTTYTYRIKAIDTDEKSSAYSNSITVSTIALPAAPGADHLLAYWSFDAIAADSLKESSKYGSTGKLSSLRGSVLTNGKLNNAITFSGASATTHIAVASAQQLNMAQSSFSVVFWMKNSDYTTPAYVFHKGSFEAGANGRTGKWYGLELKDNNIRFGVDDNVIKSEVSADATNFNQDDWLHVVAIRNVEEGELKLYINGEPIATTVDNTSGSIEHTGAFYIGNSSQQNAPYKGILDEMKIFSHPLSAAEVAGLFMEKPMQAFSPTPAQEADNVPMSGLSLQWRGNAATYNVYAGDNPEALQLIAEGVTTKTFAPEALPNSSNLYWRIDGLNNEELTEGTVWTFGTATVTSIAEETLQDLLSTYPNPFSESMQIKYNLETSDEVLIELRDMQNRILKTVVDGKQESGKHQVEIQSLNLPDGIYLLIFQHSKGRTTHKVIQKQ